MERHRTDHVSLLFGLLFAGIGAAALLDGRLLTRLWGPEVWPVLLIAVGAWVLVATLTRGVRDQPKAREDAPPGKAREEAAPVPVPAGERDERSGRQSPDGDEEPPGQAGPGDPQPRNE